MKKYISENMTNFMEPKDNDFYENMTKNKTNDKLCVKGK